MKLSLYNDGKCPVSRERLKTVTKHGASMSTQSFRSHVGQESMFDCLVGALRTIRVSLSTVAGSKQKDDRLYQPPRWPVQRRLLRHECHRPFFTKKAVRSSASNDFPLSGGERGALFPPRTDLIERHKYFGLLLESIFDFQ